MLKIGERQAICGGLLPENHILVWFQTRITILMSCFVRVGPRPRFPGMFLGESVVILVVGEQHGGVSRRSPDLWN